MISALTKNVSGPNTALTVHEGKIISVRVSKSLKYFTWTNYFSDEDNFRECRKKLNFGKIMNISVDVRHHPLLPFVNKSAACL